MNTTYEERMKQLTKRQAKEFARIRSGIVIYNASGTEFADSDIADTPSEYLCYEYMQKQYEKLLRPGEYGLSTTQQIIDYVRANF